MKVQKQGSQLVITVDLADVKSAPLSASGKSRVLYSTRGNVQAEDVSIGLNIYVKA